MRVTLRQLEYFVAAAETGSVTAAATRLFLSQSAVSTALAETEENLGVQLFVRHARGLTLTAVGREVLRDARELLDHADDFERRANTHDQGLDGGLTVGCYSTLAPHLLPPVLDAFLTAHPRVAVNFVTGSHAELRAKLGDGTCDLALLYDYEFAPPATDGLRSVVLQTRPPYVLLAPEHPLARQQEIRLEDLASEPLILFDLAPGGEYFVSLFRSRGLSPHIRFRTTEFELVRTLVARGLGYAILTQPTAIDRSYENRLLVSRPLQGEWRSLSVVAVTPQHAAPTRRTDAFLETCRRLLSPPAQRE